MALCHSLCYFDASKHGAAPRALSQMPASGFSAFTKSIAMTFGRRYIWQQKRREYFRKIRFPSASSHRHTPSRPSSVDRIDMAHDDSEYAHTCYLMPFPVLGGMLHFRYLPLLPCSPLHIRLYHFLPLRQYLIVLNRRHTFHFARFHAPHQPCWIGNIFAMAFPRCRLIDLGATRSAHFTHATPLITGHRRSVILRYYACPYLYIS